ncbi:MAG: low temperature requirement protein A [Microbacterium sp.]|nr:low temperature requirement protein A [Microbacterium sp.]
MSESAPQSTGRRVNWLELIFDLVMVACVGQIAHTMHGDPSPLAFLGFFGLLAAAWWAWVNATVTMNLFGARVTPVIWAAVTVAMIAIAFMAATVPEAFDERAAGFAIANAVIRVVWMFPWLTKRRVAGIPWWRPVLYSLVPTTLWLVSIAVPAPGRYAVWVLAIVVEAVLLIRINRGDDWLTANLDVAHLTERVALLVVIVFGESVLSIITELDLAWAPATWAAAVVGLVAVVLLAWVFFTYATTSGESGLHRLQSRGSLTGLRDTVMYLPFLLIAGVVLFAAGLGTAVAEAEAVLPAGAAVALSGGVSLYFLASAAESLRYGVAWRTVLLWGPAGIVLPWAVTLIAPHLSALGTITAMALLIVLLVALNVQNVRLMGPHAVVGGDAPPK